MPLDLCNPIDRIHTIGEEHEETRASARVQRKWKICAPPLSLSSGARFCINSFLRRREGASGESILQAAGGGKSFQGRAPPGPEVTSRENASLPPESRQLFSRRMKTYGRSRRERETSQVLRVSIYLCVVYVRDTSMALVRGWRGTRSS